MILVGGCAFVCVCVRARDVCNYERVAWRCRRGDVWMWMWIFFSRRKVGKHLITSKSLGPVTFIDCGGGFKNGATRSLFRRQSDIFHKWLSRAVWVGLKLSQQRPDHATICNIPSGIVYHKCWFGQERTLSKHGALCQREQLPRREESIRTVFTANCKTSSLGGEQDAKSVKPAANNEQNFCLQNSAGHMTYARHMPNLCSCARLCDYSRGRRLLWVLR